MWFLVACHGPDTPRPKSPDESASHTGHSATHSDPDETASTGETALVPVLSDMTCAPRTDGPLRWDCAIDRVAPGDVTVSWTSAGETFETETREDVVTLWGLAPSAATAWTASDGLSTVSGSFTTDPLPAALSIDVQGTALSSHVLLNGECGGTIWILLASTDGTIRWIESSATNTSGYAWDPPDSVVFAVQRSAVQDVTVDGERRSYGPFDRPIHHDLAREPGGERLAVLDAMAWPWTDGRTWVFDGFYLLDAAGAVVSEWDFVDHAAGIPSPARPETSFWAAQFPGAGDFAHANGITWTPDGDLLVSFRYLSAVYQIAGPDRPDAGAVDWVLSGSVSGVPSDWTRVSAVPGEAADFLGQHHPTLHADGTLTLFDNGPVSGTSRALTFALDPTTHVATLVDAIDLGTRCQLIGSSFRLPDGGTMVTCADQRFAREYGPGETSWRWQATVQCPDTPSFNVNHVEPVTLPGFQPPGR